MTVAIAALCGWPNDVAIIAAEDRMITAGDIEFNQPQPKMWRLGDHSVAMFFGLSAAQAQVALRTEIHIAERAISSVSQIAETYAWYLRDFVRREAEADLLAPLGLTLADLVKHPSTINRSLGRDLAKQIQNYYYGSGLADDLGGAIIIGSDETGGHIFQVENGKTTFMNGIGFAAAGGGQWHAQSQFMFYRYSREWLFPDTLSLLYAAKKRAEASPGVGQETDIVVITTRPRGVIHARADSELVQGLEAIYQDHKRKQDDDFGSQHKSVKAFVDALLEKSRVPQAQPSSKDEPAATQTEQATPSEVVVVTPPPAVKRVLRRSTHDRKGRTPSPA